MPIIELITFKGCQSTADYLNLLEPAIGAAGLDAEVRMVLVPSANHAERQRLFGSPTILIDGEEYQPERRGPAGFY